MKCRPRWELKHNPMTYQLKVTAALWNRLFMSETSVDTRNPLVIRRGLERQNVDVNLHSVRQHHSPLFHLLPSVHLSPPLNCSLQHSGRKLRAKDGNMNCAKCNTIRAEARRRLGGLIAVLIVLKAEFQSRRREASFQSKHFFFCRDFLPTVRQNGDAACGLCPTFLRSEILISRAPILPSCQAFSVGLKYSSANQQKQLP